MNEPLRHRILGKELSSRILEKCRTSEVSVNDLALALLFRVCRKWNEMQGCTKASTRLRLLMPLDMRSRSDLTMPATNRLSFSFLGRTHAQCERWDELLASVQAETEKIKATRVYIDFLDGLAAVATKPKWMKRLIRWNGNMSTSVLTYTGDIARGMKSQFPEHNGRRQIGDTFLENILIAPPARRNTNVTLGLCINWGKICISANWNRSTISSADCEALLELYGDAWQQWLESPTPSTTVPRTRQ